MNARTFASMLSMSLCWFALLSSNCSVASACVELRAWLVLRLPVRVCPCPVDHDATYELLPLALSMVLRVAIAAPAIRASISAFATCASTIARPPPSVTCNSVPLA